MQCASAMQVRCPTRGSFTTAGRSSCISHPLCNLKPVRYRALPVAHAKRDDEDVQTSGAASVVKTLDSAMDSLASLVPENVPRPAAKTGVSIVSALIAFSLLKQVISGIFTLAVIGGLGFWWLTRQAPDDDDTDGPSRRKTSSSSQQASDLGDPLSDAQRIMDKYK